MHFHDKWTCCLSQRTIGHVTKIIALLGKLHKWFFTWKYLNQNHFFDFYLDFSKSVWVGLSLRWYQHTVLRFQNLYIIFYSIDFSADNIKYIFSINRDSWEYELYTNQLSSPDSSESSLADTSRIGGPGTAMFVWILAISSINSSHLLSSISITASRSSS